MLTQKPHSFLRGRSQSPSRFAQPLSLATANTAAMDVDASAATAVPLASAAPPPAAAAAALPFAPVVAAGSPVELPLPTLTNDLKASITSIVQKVGRTLGQKGSTTTLSKVPALGDMALRPPRPAMPMEGDVVDTPHAQDSLMSALQAVQELRERNLSLREENAELAEEILLQDGLQSPEMSVHGVQWTVPALQGGCDTPPHAGQSHASAGSTMNSAATDQLSLANADAPLGLMTRKAPPGEARPAVVLGRTLQAPYLSATGSGLSGTNATSSGSSTGITASPATGVRVLQAASSAGKATMPVHVVTPRPMMQPQMPQMPQAIAQTPTRPLGRQLSPSRMGGRLG